MRAINIKNIHITHPYYVLIGFLLLCFASLADNQVVSQSAKLLASAQHQQQKLIDDYALSQQPKWQKKCRSLMGALQLNLFKKCLIIQAPFANAYALANGNVVLTEMLLQNINNDDQLAHILAHEHAHLRLNHFQQTQQLLNNPPKLFTKSRIKKFYRNLEQQADQAADQKLLQLARDPLQIHHYLLRTEQQNDEHSNDHQQLKHRIHRNGLPAEVVESFWLNN